MATLMPFLRYIGIEKDGTEIRAVPSSKHLQFYPHSQKTRYRIGKTMETMGPDGDILRYTERKDFQRGS